MRVVQLLGPSTGGIRRTVATLSLALRRAGHEVTTAGPPGVLEPLVATDRIVPVPAGLRPWTLVVAAQRLRSLDTVGAVIHAQGLKAGWVALLARRRPWVLTVHNVVLPGSAGAALLRRLERMVVARADAVIATSDEISVTFADVARRIATIRPVHEIATPSGDTAVVRSQFARPEELLAVCVARLHAQKGLDTLLDAWALGVAARLVVVGEGPEADALAARRDRLGLGDRVTFLGHRDDVPAILAAADVVVIPSRWESGPLVLLEALALGRPVVTTRVGFVEEVVGRGAALEPAAVVLEPDVDPPGLAAAVGALLAEPDRRARLAAAGPPAARPFLDPAPMVEATLAVYREVSR